MKDCAPLPARRSIRRSRLLPSVAAFACFAGLACRESSDETISQATPQALPQADPSAAPDPSLPPSLLRLAGATFPAPLYQRWSARFEQEQFPMRIQYSALGSAEGLRLFLSGRADLAAGDAYLTEQEQLDLLGDWLPLPVAAGALALAFRLPGVETLSLSREAYAGVLVGAIRTWNDPCIAAANPAVELPDLPIAVFHRQDAAGTSWVLSEHLQRANPWPMRVAPSRRPAWPVGEGARGEEGVALAIAGRQGGIGYVSLAAARAAGLSVASLQNRSGRFVAPSEAAVRRTIAPFAVADDFQLWLVDPVGEDSYPLTMYTYLFARGSYESPSTTRAVRALLRYALGPGQQDLQSLGLSRLSPALLERVRQMASTIGVNQPSVSVAVPPAGWLAGVRAKVIGSERDRMLERGAR